MSEEKKRIITLLQRLYAAIKSTNKNVSSIKEDNMVLLWENSSPGSEFAAQTIKIDLSDYRLVKIEAMPHAGRTAEVTINEFQCPGAGDIFAPTTRSDMGSSGWWHGSRAVSITTTGITFGSGGYRYSNATSIGSGDGYGAPLRIWGIKKSYSVSLVKDVLPAENGGTGVTSLEELKSKLGVISGGGSGSGGSGGGGPLTLSDSRLLQTYLSLRNKELWSGPEWGSGSKTIPGISNYEKLLVFLWDGYNGIELDRVGTNPLRFRGGGFVSHVSSNTSIHTDIVVDLSFTEDDVVTMEYASVLGHTSGGSHQTVTDGWAIRIVGVEPTAAYVKEKLGISDTTIEDGTIKFKPVDVENRTLLWTNPNFNATTFEAQTIDVPWQNYNAICVEYAYNPGGSKPYKDSCTVACPESGGSSVGHLEFLWLTTSGASNGAERYFTIKDGGIEFDKGWYGANNAAASVHNEFCVPLYIYGIKNKITVDIPKVELSNFGGATIDPDKVITLKDYVVDEYNAGDWNVIKYASGKADLYYRKDNMSFTKVTSYGYSYMTDIFELQLPLSLAQIDYANGSVGGSWTYAVDVTSMDTNAIKYRFMSYAHDWTTQSGISIMFHVHGLWKALDTTPKEVAAVKENTARLSIDMEGYEKRTLLWTNPSVTTNFNPQTLTFDGVYDELEVFFNYDVTYPDRTGNQRVIVGDNDETILNATWGGNTARRVVAKIVNGKTTLEIQKGVRYISTEGESNSVCIPYKVYGIQNGSKLEGKVTGDNLTLDIGVNAPADLNPDTLIPSGADLNNYTAVGSYKSVNAANSKTLSNTPYTGGGFNLQVISTSLDDIKQVLIANSANTALVYIRSITASGTVNDWVQMGTTVITKVWENASIGSTFAAQTLKIPATADYILILTNRGQVIIVPKNAGQIIYYGCEAYPNQRAFTYTNNSLAVTAGEVLNSGWKTNNDALKPWKIFELKGVL